MVRLVAAAFLLGVGWTGRAVPPDTARWLIRAGGTEHEDHREGDDRSAIGSEHDEVGSMSAPSGLLVDPIEPATASALAEFGAAGGVALAIGMLASGATGAFVRKATGRWRSRPRSASRSASRWPWRWPRRWPWRWRAAIALATGALAFSAGSARMMPRLDEAAGDTVRMARLLDAAADEDRAGAGDRASASRVHLVEARVASRQADRFGSEVVLEAMRPISAGGGDGGGDGDESGAADGKREGGGKKEEGEEREDGVANGDDDLDAGRPLPRRARLRLEPGRAVPAGRPPPAHPEVDPDRSPWISRADRLLWPGAWVRLALRLEPERGRRNPGRPDPERALARRGIAVRARLVDPAWVVEVVPEDPLEARVRGLRVGLSRSRALLRRRVAAHFERRGLDAGLARALVLGDRAGLADPAREGFARLGLAHLFAVSGLHVGFVALGVGWLVARLQALFAPRPAGAGWPFGRTLSLACLLTIGFAWLSGGGLPVQRAGAMFLLFALARGGRGRVGPGEALAAAALGLAFLEPAAVFQLGAQLSFAACAGIVWALPPRGGAAAGRAVTTGGLGGAEPTPGRLTRAASGRRTAGARRWRGVLREALRASLAASLATAPWLLGAGLPVWPGGPWLNLVAIPWTGLVVLPCAAAAITGAAVLPDPVLALLLAPGQLMAWLASRGGALVGRFAPGDGLPPAAGAAICLAGLFGLRRARLGWAALAWLVVAGIGSPPWRHGAPLPPPPRAIFFDVGQADAALVEGAGARLLIDSGGAPPRGRGGAGLVRTLRALGATELGALVITHGDLDHRGGAERILAELEVGALWLPRASRGDPPLARLAERAREVGIPVRWLAAGDRAALAPDLRLEVLWPEPGARGSGAGGTGRRNAGSLVLRVALAGTSLLFTGDIGAPQEQRLLEAGAALDAAVLKVAHHGSARGTSVRFLAASAPRLAVLSAPCRTQRGLPRRVVFERLAAAGVPVAWTGRDGALVVRPRGDRGIEVAAWGASRRCRPG